MYNIELTIKQMEEILELETYIWDEILGNDWETQNHIISMEGGWNKFWDKHLWNKFSTPNN